MLPNHTFSTVIGGIRVTAESGKLAEQAGGSVTFKVGDCVLLATATMSKTAMQGMDFFPLSAEYEERLYAAGRIPGSFFRREGKPSTKAVLTSRLIDRPLRPLFPKGMRNEVQVIVTALSSDSIYHLDTLAVNAASCAIAISDIPWNGPIAAIRIAYINGELVVEPTIPESETSSLDLRVAGSRDAILMVEASGNEIPEELMLKALTLAHEKMQPMIDMQEEMRRQIGKPKRELTYYGLENPMLEPVQERVGDRLFNIIAEQTVRQERGDAITTLTEEIVAEFVAENPEVNKVQIEEAIQTQIKMIVRDRILHDGIRPDGRDYKTIRELSAEVGLLPRTHGSGLFRRGQTQVMSIVTLGMPREAEKLDGLFPEDTRRYIHHYNFPPFSTGETWPMRGPKRREIGHGALAENALIPVIPSEEEFPYTIRVVSEVLSSNGSTSQGSVCASTLALMDGGVPIKKPVAGIAMGLIYDDETGKYAILTDIQGMEDHLGDMDFKVAGTADGITAIQMDIKLTGISLAMMTEALSQAKQARLDILKMMNSVISAPRAELGKYAPRMLTTKINPDQIGAVIGKGGSTIRSIQDEFAVVIDIQEDGTVLIAGIDGERSALAVGYIERLTRGVTPGEVYTGKVVRIVDFGAFVELLPGIEGLVHISQLAPTRIKSVDSVVNIGDEIMVMVIDVDNNDKVRLSRKAVLNGWTLEEARADDSGGSRPSGGGGGGDRRSSGGGGGGDRRSSGGGSGDRRSSSGGSGDRRGGGGGGRR